MFADWLARSKQNLWIQSDNEVGDDVSTKSVTARSLDSAWFSVNIFSTPIVKVEYHSQIKIECKHYYLMAGYLDFDTPQILSYPPISSVLKGQRDEMRLQS